MMMMMMMSVTQDVTYNRPNTTDDLATLSGNRRLQTSVRCFLQCFDTVGWMTGRTAGL